METWKMNAMKRADGFCQGSGAEVHRSPGQDLAGEVRCPTCGRVLRKRTAERKTLVKVPRHKPGGGEA